jgi:hypothetical protein
MKKVFFLLLGMIFIMESALSAEKADSVANATELLREIESPVVKRSWFAVPIGFYQEETSVGFGATGGYYFKSHDLSKISSISGSIIYTLNNQAKININPRFYFFNNKMYLSGNVNLRHYPDHYYGIGNTPPVDDMLYTAQTFSVNVQPFYLFNENVMLGMYLGVRGERLLLADSVAAMRPYVQQQYGLTGWDPYFMFGMGVQFAYDSRDNGFYPQKFSNFLKFSAITYQQALGSSFSVTSFALDFRQYIPTWLGQVFAWQVYADVNLGKEIPFQMLPTIGGSDKLRGFRERKYTDNSMFLVQAEYRIPIWWRLKAAVFCSVGDVFDVYNPTIHRVKIGYGAGLRFRLNDARVNLRLDVAGNNEGEVKFYITATEAF